MKTLSQLNNYHQDWEDRAPVWRTIDTLKAGHPAIAKDVSRFLPKRPIEDDELYRLRVSKLAYTPIMQHIFSVYTGKIAESGLVYPDMLTDGWQAFIRNTAHRSTQPRHLSGLALDLFSSILHYGKCVSMVDTYPQVANVRSLYELRSTKLLPYVTLVNPLNLIDWGTNWYVIREYVVSGEAFGESLTHARYRHVTESGTTTYSIPVQLHLSADRDGNNYNSIHRVLWDGEWVLPDDQLHSWEPTEETSQYTSTNIDVTTVGDDKWLGLVLANKQIQHMQIENAWTDAGYLSGTVQRVFTPADAKPNDDPRTSYAAADTEQLALAGNQHILVGKGYQFVESTGDALANLQNMLQDISKQMLKTANLGFISGDGDARSQSGLSKKMDMSLLVASLSQYGQVVLNTLNSIIATVADVGLLEPLEVLGLSDFSGKDPTTIIDAVNIVANIEDFPADGRQALYSLLLRELDIQY